MKGLKFLLSLNHDYAFTEGSGDTITVADETFPAESPADILKAVEFLNEATDIKAKLTPEGLVVEGKIPFEVSETLTSAHAYWQVVE